MTPNSRSAKGDGENNEKVIASAGDDNVRRLTLAILAYLKEHPGAADNAIGIRRWWLPPPLGNVSSTEVAGALAAMVAEGLLQTQQLPGGHVIFAGVRSNVQRN